MISHLTAASAEALFCQFNLSGYFAKSFNSTCILILKLGPHLGAAAMLQIDEQRPL
jgi:hypothetical protein